MSDEIEAAIETARTSGSFRLSDIPLNELPPELRRLRDLRELSVTECGLTVVPEWLDELTALEHVDISYNPIASLPPLPSLTSLRMLGLSELALSEFPAALRGLPRLEVLTLAGTSITSLPRWIGELRALRSLDLGATGLSELPRSFARLDRLTHLSLWEHKFQAVPDVLASLSALQMLDLSNAGVHDVPEEGRQTSDPAYRAGFGGLTRLIGRVAGEQGALSSLPVWIADLPLQTLYAGGQRLQGELPPLPQTLKQLWLGGNELGVVPHAASRLPRLQALDLHENGIAHVPAFLREFRELRLLDLRDNELTIPPEVLNAVEAPERILNFVARVEGPTRRLDEAKLLVVGEGSVGKTSLIKRLTAGGFSMDEPKTEGIEVHRWGMATDGTATQLNVWDFGGQEIMHATHQFFLTKRSLYVLVIDARQGEEQNRVEYWLKLIHSFGGASPVIIVGNKTEQSVLDIDERGLRAKYPNVVDILSISCMTGDGIRDLERRLSTAIEQMPHVRDLLPAAYFDVKKELEDLDVDYITYADYQRLCARHGVDDAVSRETLVEFLHDLGTVLCFRDDPRLSDTNILNPEWVTGGVYRLLNSHLAAQRKGLLSWDSIDEILDTDDYPPERRAFIIDVMQRFELCYESDRTFLIPDLLTKQEPDTGTWEGALVFEIGYDVLPSSVLSRLIVRMHPMISKGTVWRTGLVVAMDGNRGLVKGDREDRVIRIAIDGPASGRRGLLTAIRTELWAIAQTIPGLASEQRVPVPGRDGVFVPYDHLLELEAAGRTSVVPQGLVEDFNIRELLGGIEAPSARAADRRGGSVVDSGDDAAERRALAAGAWTPEQSMRLGRSLVGAVVVLAAVFVGIALLVGLVAAVAVTTIALIATLAVAVVVLRSSGRLSEEGFLAALRELLARVPRNSPSG